MSKKQIAVVAFWIVYAGVLGPVLISHSSYELPIAGLALAVAGAWATYHVFFKRIKE